ncbi:hypothetical protein AYO22_10391 [Fonsecaea multimorphosa]|nr:hypothetical protein AYO22_10391 [Fonsecaea multimorphosa]
MRLGPDSSVQVWEVANSKMGSRSGENVIMVRSLASKGAPRDWFPAPCETNVLTTHAHFFAAPVPGPFTYRFQDNVSEVLQSSPRLIAGFYSTYDLFMLGPTFAPRYRAAIRHSYSSAPTLLQDIYAALFNVCKRAKLDPGPLDESDLAPGAWSLWKLRNMRICGPRDALATMALGQALAAFDFMTVCRGPSPILRYALTVVQPWYEDLAEDAAFDPVTISPIFWDTIWCLLRREIPVLQFRLGDRVVVHHVAGLCTTLLPILYDLCVISNELQGWDASSSSWSGANVRIQQIEQRLLSWMPRPPPDFTSKFSEQEILAVNAQAQMYRSAALLIATRLLNPLGTNDDLASWYAHTIIYEFAEYRTSTVPGTRLHNVAFPILVASMEIPDIPSEVWKSITSLALAPLCLAKMQAMRDHIWAERRAGSTSFMLDLVNQAPSFVVMP